MNIKQVRETHMENPLNEENPKLNGPISYDEIEKIIIKLKINKSSGIDQIPNEVLKNHDVMLPLFILFTKCLESGIVPTIWLKALISPVAKSASKDPYNPLIYRGISLLSCVSKVISGLINNHVINYCELGDLLVDEQGGFRKNRARVDHMYTITSILRNRLSENKSTFTCFIDMPKAFDWVDRDMLFYKLLEYNINGKIYKSIKALHNHPLSKVKVNIYTTSWFTTESGVRQGDSLSPTLLLFILMI